jgi:hypothetical protein
MAAAKRKLDKKTIATEIADFRKTYEKTFGAMPPSPGNRFAFSGEVNPEYLVHMERLRGHAMYSEVFDNKTAQMILFAAAHAGAARHYGATWEELHKVVELAATSVMVWRSNRGTGALKALRDKEKPGKGR